MRLGVYLFISVSVADILLAGCAPIVTEYRPDGNGRYIRASTSRQLGASPGDDIFVRRVDQCITNEEATGHPGVSSRSTKEFWQSWYRGIRSNSVIPWHPSEFKDSEDLVAYIKQKRREHRLPTYDPADLHQGARL